MKQDSFRIIRSGMGSSDFGMILLCQLLKKGIANLSAAQFGTLVTGKGFFLHIGV